MAYTGMIMVLKCLPTISKRNPYIARSGLLRLIQFNWYVCVCECAFLGRRETVTYRMQTNTTDVHLVAVCVCVRY